MGWKTFTVALAVVSSGAAAAAAQNDDQADIRFRRMDTDRDGVITRAEWRGNNRSFDRHDWNGDGVLSGDEVRRGERDGRNDGFAGTSGSQMQAPADLFSRVDANGNGWIGPNEWPGSTATFDELDVDGDRRLSRDELPATSGGRSGSQSGAYQSGYERGLLEGRQAGREDYDRRQDWDLDGQRELQEADSGYVASMGSRGDYQAGYRQGFRLGYRQGFEAAERRQ
jgi:hypothetical protein